jgi:hypothetical protein
MDSLNNYTTTDAYSIVNGLVLQPGTVRLDLFIYNAAVYFQLWDDTQRGFQPNETFMAPGERSFSWHCGGVRFRSAVAGVPAQVTAVVLNAQDISDG